MLTKGFTDELKMLNAESVIGASANELLHNTMTRIGKHVDNPLRMYAAATPDSKLYFSANVIEVGDGAGKSTLPIEGNIGTFVATNIDMQTGVVTGGTVNMLGGGSFALPASTLNYYRRLCFSFQSDGSLQASFSSESATTGGLSNAGAVFNSMSGLPVGYIDLQCDDIIGKYRTAGSSSSIIENKVGSYYTIMRFAGGGGGGAAYGLVADVQTLDANKSASAGISPKVSRADHVHPISSGVPSSQSADTTNSTGSSSDFARADHIHNIATATPTDIGSANAQGSASTFTKSDHVHKGIHSVKAETGGTQRFGDLVLKKDIGITITDNGDGSFSFKGSPPSLLDPTYESTFTYYTRSDFSIEQKTFFDSTTGTDDIIDTGKITLDASQDFISKELTGTMMIADAPIVNAIQIKTQYNTGYMDLIPTITGSIDGGNTWVSSYQQAVSGRNVITDIDFAASISPIFDAGTPNGTLTSDYYIAEIFQPTYRMTLTAFGAYTKYIASQTYGNSDITSVSLSSNGASWQNIGSTFMAATTGSVTSAQFYGRQGTSTSGTIAARIYSVSGGLPDTLLGSSDPINASSLPIINAWVTLTFSTPVSLTSGTVYAVSFYCDTANNARVAYRASDVYPTYNLVWSDANSPSWAAYTTMDMPFQITQTSSATGSVVGKLMAVSGGVPTTEIATSKETMVIDSDITTTSAYKIFSFNNVALASDTQYALVLSSTVTLTVDQVTSSPAYILGSATSADGSSWSGSGTGLAFQVYGVGLDVRIKIVSGTASSELSGFGVEMVNNTPTVYSGESAYETRIITATEASTGTITLSSVRFTPGAHQLHCNYSGHDFMAPDFLEMGGQVVQFPVGFFVAGDVVKFYVTYGINNSENTDLTINNIVSSNSTLGSIQIPTGFTLDKPWMEIPAGATISGAGNIETTGLITGAGTLASTGTVLSTGAMPTQPKYDYVQEYTLAKGVLIQGRTDGSGIPAGYIGEELRAINVTTPLYIPSNVVTNIAILIVTPGIWDLSAMLDVAAASSASITRWWLGVSKTSATLAGSGYWVNGECSIHGGEMTAGGWGEYCGTITPGRVILTTPTTFYFVTKAIHSNGPTDVQAAGQLRALRVG